MTIALDPRVLERTTRELLRHDLALGDEARVPAPDTGASSGLTADGIDRVTGQVRDLADDLHQLSDALEAFVESAFVTDDQVAGILDAILAGGLR
jgi:hypothetical protein